MGRAASLLRDERYVEAQKLQQGVIAGLERLLATLSTEEWKAELERLKEFQKRLDALIERQGRLIESAQKAAADELKAAAGDQQGVQKETDALAREASAARGDSPASRSLGQASRSMGAAAQGLAQGAREQSLRHQEDAQEALKAARREIQRQVRELLEMRQRETLLRLIVALQDMLTLQQSVRGETAEADKRLAGLRTVPREEALLIGELARRERRVGAIAGEALALLEEDGTAPVAAGALQAAGADVESAARLLDDLRAGAATQGVQRDVEEQIAALLDAFRQEQKQRVQDPQSALREAERRPDGKPPLVPLLVELKLMRNMQAALNGQTAKLDGMRTQAGALSPEASEQLERVAARQGALAAMAFQLHGLLSEGEKR
jgi:hypothetical protein